MSSTGRDRNRSSRARRRSHNSAAFAVDLARRHISAQPASSSRRRARRGSRLLEDDAAAYAFLVGPLIDAPTLARALRTARRWRTRPHAVLIALGWITVDAYERALARYLGVRRWDASMSAGATVTLIRVEDYRPDEIAALVRLEASVGRAVMLIGRELPETFGPDDPAWVEQALEQATHGLMRRHPELSAGAPLWFWQRLACVVCCGLLLGGAAVAPAEVLVVLAGLIALPFALVTGLRALALWHLVVLGSDRVEGAADADIVDGELPLYTVLVPLFDEANIVGELVAVLAAIDYPRDKLDILIILEAGDLATRQRLARLRLADHMRVLVVPAGKLRTKPRALNFGLRHARGDFIAVYDAEDLPEPDQLRRAYAVLRARPDEVGCVQARLNIYNPKVSWLTRQFTIEYSALFDGLLPTLQRFDLPIPLGGTSNHFPGIA